MLEDLRILILDDDQLDYKLILNQLKRSKLNFDHLYCSCKTEFEAGIFSFSPNLILSDYDLKGYLGLEALEFSKQHCPDVPFIIITGSLDEETAANCIKSGAWEYVLKENLKRLLPAINSAFNLQKVLQKNKDTELKLKKSEAYYRLMFESANDAIFLVKDGKFIDCNKRTEEIFGLNRYEFIGLSPFHLSPELQSSGKSSFYEYKRLLKKSVDLGKYRFEWIHKRADGTPFYADVSLNLIDFHGDKIIQAVVRDIDASKRAQIELEQKEQQLRLTIESSPVGVCLTDVNGCFLDTNKALCDMLKYTRKELLGKHFNNFTHPEDIEHNNKLFDKLNQKLLKSYDLEKRYICKDGSIVYAFIRSQMVLDENNDPNFEIAIIENITEQKKAEKAFKQSEEKFHNFYHNASIGIYQARSDGEIIMANPALVKMLGYESFEELKHIKLHSKRNFERREFLEKISQTGEVVGLETMWPHKSGSSIYVRESARAIRDNEGRIVMFEGTAEDITKNKLAAQALETSESRFRNLYEYSPISILEEDFSKLFEYIQALKSEGIKDFEQFFTQNPAAVKKAASLIKVIDVNSTTLWLYDSKSKEELLTSLDTFLPEKAYVYFIEQLVAIAKGEKTFQGESINRTFVGKEKHIFLKWDVQPGCEKNYNTVLLSIIDISQRKNAEQKLQEREEFSNALFMYNPVETIVVDKKGAVVRFNESVSKMRRRVPNPGDIMYKDFAAGHSVDMYSVLHNCMKTGATKIIPESRYNATYFSITIAPFEKGAIIAAIDITRRKMAIEQITALNRVFENLGTNPEDNINYIVNRTKSILKSFCAIYIQMDGNDNIVCINSSKNTPDDILEQADSLKNLYFTPNNKELNKAIIIDNLKHTNVYWEIPELKKYDFKSMLGFPIIKNGKHVGSLCIIDTVFRKFSNNDIYTISTLAKAIAISEDRKIDKLNIIQSLSEKEILLKEVHHRVKNNIQIISSLLRLQSHHVENQEILHILKDSQNRVKAMALVHEKLYKSHDLAHIDFLDYIQSLLINLFSSLNVNSSHINFNTDIEEISLNIDTAIPLGLIISELVTNSIKYAFPEERKGTIAISLHRKEESFLINVSDNGIGFQNDTNPMDSQTLGLQLISALAKQLHGNFEFNTQSGTEFTMMFSEK